MDKISNYWVYILWLKDDKYYVGISRNVLERFEQHASGEGAAWTHKHRPICIEWSSDTGTKYKVDAEQIENVVTIQWMLLKGIENVRGGDYCVCDFDELTELMDDKTFDEIIRYELGPDLSIKQARKIAKRIYGNTQNKQKRDREIMRRTYKKKINGPRCQVEMCWHNHGRRCDIGLSPWNNKKECEKNYKVR